MKDFIKNISPKLRHTIIEGWLYWYTAFGVAFQEYLSSEEAYKYCNPILLFWLKAFIGSSVVGFNAVKAFRSMTFGRAYSLATPPPAIPITPVTPDPTISVSVQQPKQPIK